MFLRDKPNLLSEIRRATHYGVTPEKQEVDDLRSEVGSLRLQVTDMDGRIEALSRMVDRLLEERSAGTGECNGGGVGVDGAMMKHEIPSSAGWAKKRRIEGEWDGASEASRSEGAGVVRMQAGPPACVKMEAGQETGASEEPSRSRSVQVKPELSVSPGYEFVAGAMGGDGTGAVSDGDGAGMIIGGGPLCRDSSFLRELDNMSIGSEVGGGGGGGGGGSLGPLQLIDVTGEDEGVSADVMTESFFNLDFEAEIISMSGLVPGLDDQQPESLGSERNNSPVAKIDSDASKPAAATAAFSPSAPAAVAAAPIVDGGTALHDQEARIEELTASLDSMPAESRRKLAEGLLALAQNPAVVSTFATGGAAGPVVATAASPAATAQNGGASVTPETVSMAAPETPEIALPLASAALGAFMVHYAQAQAVKEPASAVAAAVAMDASRHAIKRATSLR